MPEEWGKVIYTIINTDIARQVDLQFAVSESLINAYSPIIAFIYNMILQCLASILLGVLIFAFALLLDKRMVLILGVTFIGLDLLIYNVLPVSYYWFSPISLGKLVLIDPKGITNYPSLAYAICGLIPYDSGEIYVDEKIVGKEIQIPNDVGVIIEHPSFLMNYNGFRNLKMLADINDKIDSNHIREIMKMVGLDYKSKKPVSKYSLGMKQRLGIAQAIMENNKILILDEPMNGLDNSGVESIRKLLIQLKNQGTTIILSSHNPEDIRIMCDTVVLTYFNS